jgi:hypothetical protein
MIRTVKRCRGGVVPCMLILCLAAMAAGSIGAKGSLGIYIYENIEGYHTVSSTAGTELTSAFLPVFEKVMVYDRIPLQSNETVRILEEMTEDRKVAITAISTWLSGGVISAPTVTFADDDIKFKDLTWHIDQEAIIADAKKTGMTHALIGTISGFVKSVEGMDAKGRLVSVNATANLKLLDVSQGTVVWAETYRDVKAGFDARSAFEDAVLDLSAKAGGDVLAFLAK